MKRACVVGHSVALCCDWLLDTTLWFEDFVRTREMSTAYEPTAVATPKPKAPAPQVVMLDTPSPARLLTALLARMR